MTTNATRAYLLTAGGREQEVRYHHALIDHELHAVLQYRHPEDELEWSTTDQTVCGEPYDALLTVERPRIDVACTLCLSVWNNNE